MLLSNVKPIDGHVGRLDAIVKETYKESQGDSLYYVKRLNRYKRRECPLGKMQSAWLNWASCGKIGGNKEEMVNHIPRIVTQISPPEELI